MNETILNSPDEVLEPLREEFTDKLEVYRKLLGECESLAKLIINSENLVIAHQLAHSISAAANFERQTLFPIDKVIDEWRRKRSNNISSLKIAQQGFRVIRKTAEELEVEPSSPNALRKAKVIGAATEMVLQLSGNSDL